MKHVPKDIKERVVQLRKEVARLRDLYHSKDVSEISDEALDSLKKELADIEKKYPSLKKKDSPTQVVAGSVKQGFQKVTHQVRQWSFNDVFDEEELESFDTRIKKDLQTEKVEYFLEEKIDGVKVILEYKDGKLFRAATRGDGKIGEDITDNVKTIKNIPHKLKKNVNIIVEGEAYLKIKDFDKINKQQEKEGEPTYANPRNLVAGFFKTT